MCCRRPGESGQEPQGHKAAGAVQDCFHDSLVKVFCVDVDVSSLVAEGVTSVVSLLGFKFCENAAWLLKRTDYLTASVVIVRASTKNISKRKGVVVALLAIVLLSSDSE
jgi:hypothetical protein